LTNSVGPAITVVSDTAALMLFDGRKPGAQNGWFCIAISDSFGQDPPVAVVWHLKA